MIKKSSGETNQSGYIGLMTKKSDGSKWFLCKLPPLPWWHKGNDWDPIPPPWTHKQALLGNLKFSDDLLDSEDKVHRYFGSYKNAYTLDKVIHITRTFKTSSVTEFEGLEKQDLKPLKIQ